MFRDWIDKLARNYGEEVAFVGGWPAPEENLLRIRFREVPKILQKFGGGFPPSGLFATRSQTTLAHALALMSAAYRGLTVFPLSARASRRETGQLALLYRVSVIWEDGSMHPLHGAGRRNGASLSGEGVLISTSGSAGKPKIVFLTWESLFWNARAANERVRVGVGDMWFVDLPLWHVSGLCAMVRALEAGATVCLAGGPEEQATHRSCVPTQLRRWLDSGRTPGMLRELLVGGASMPAGMRIEASQKGWPARATYGLTEAGSQVCTGEKVGMPGEDLVSCGKPLEGWEIRLIDGEIWIRGKGLFAGYVKPEGDVVSEKCEGGWFATGDVGEWNERGELRVLGRRDRMILCAGEKVYPERIEAELKALKGIRQVFALGVEDREYGQRVVVFVDGEGEVGRWKEYLRERVSGLEMPVRWYRWPVENVLQDSSAGTMKPQGKFFEELLARGTVGTYKLEEIG